MQLKDATIIDVAAKVADIANLWMLSIGGVGIVTGAYYDYYGNQIGVSFTTSLSATVPKRLDGSTVEVHAIPANAIGFAGTLTTFPMAMAYIESPFGDDGAIFADFIANPSRYYQKAATTALTLGRVA